MIAHFASVLERDLAANLSNGWREVNRSWVPSCFQFQVLLEWQGEKPPEVERTL